MHTPCHVRMCPCVHVTCAHVAHRYILVSLIEDVDFNLYFINACANCTKDPRQYSDWESLDFTSFFDLVFLIKCPVSGIINDDEYQDDEEYEARILCRQNAYIILNNLYPLLKPKGSIVMFLPIQLNVITNGK